MNNVTTKIYIADTTELEDEISYQRAYRMVTVERQKKADRFRSRKGKRLSVGVEFLLMQGLQAWGLKRSDVTFRYGARGKPYLAGEHGVFFNLSHSGDLVVCAISNREIGCDVQKLMDKKKNVAEHFFAREEYETILNQPSERERQEMFFRLWTLKESFLKVTGEGMNLPMDSFCIHVDEGGIAVRQEYDNRNYYFQEINPGAGYQCSVCGLDPAIGTRQGISVERCSLLF